MTTRHRPRAGLIPGRLVLTASGALASAWLAACSIPFPPPAAGPAGSSAGATRADAARQQACRQHADQVYVEQNRSAIYLDEGAQQSYSPFSGAYVEGNTARGLPSDYQRQEMVSDCIRNTDTAAAPTQPPTAPPGPAVAPPAR